jgi:hypothetical protein
VSFLLAVVVPDRCVYTPVDTTSGMPIQREEVDDLRPLEFREPEEVLDADKLYTIYEISRLLQGLDVDAELDVETENVLLDWTIPWMMQYTEKFVFAEPREDSEPGYYGLAAE